MTGPEQATQGHDVAVTLLIGGKGFLGSAVARRMVADDTRVVCLEPDVTSPGKLADLADAVELVAGSAADREGLVDVVRRVAPDSILNLTYARGLTIADEMDVMCRGLWNSLEAGRIGGCGRVVLASSVRVYGPQALHGDDVFLNEESACLPVTRYGVAKLLGERLASDFREAYGLTGAALRIPLVYGPGIREGAMGVAVPAVAAARRAAVALRYDPDAMQCLAHVDDVAQALSVLADVRRAPPAHVVYELGGQVASYREMAATAEALVPECHVAFNAPLEPGAGPEHQFAYQLDNARIRTEYGIVHRSLAQGYRTIVDAASVTAGAERPIAGEVDG